MPYGDSERESLEILKPDDPAEGRYDHRLDSLRPLTRAHIICGKAHTVSAKNLLLLGKLLLLSQYKVGGWLLLLGISCHLSQVLCF